MSLSAPRLLVITSAPGDSDGDHLVLDGKFIEGMRFYSQSWPGPVSCLLRRSSRALPFSQHVDPADLPFGASLRPAGHHIQPADLEGHDLVLCSGDNPDFLHVADLCRRMGIPSFYIIEYIPETRRQIIMLDRGRSLPRKLKSLLSTRLHERRRRRAFATADGLQANGYPAAAHYRTINPNTLLYLDNRIAAHLLVTPAEMAARRQHQMAGGPLRLIHSGRLEPMKGSQDLIPIARRLRDGGTDFALDIFGSGSLEDEIRAGIVAQGLGQQVRLKGSVDFETELVPYARQHGDVFLSCHRQSDPSCSYLENMGCGLAVAGYANRMWAALAEDSKAGWVEPLGNWQALADRLAGVAADRTELDRACAAARDFASRHLFEAEFARRIAQLRDGTGKEA